MTPIPNYRTCAWTIACIFIALLGCEQPSKRKSNIARSQILAEVGQTLITKQDFQKALQQLSPFARSQYNNQRRKAAFLEQLIQLEMLVQEAKQQGLTTHPSVKRIQHKAMIALLIKQLVQSTKLNSISDKELKRYYQQLQKRDPSIASKPLQHIQDKLRQDVRQARQKQAYKRFLASLRKKYPVKIDETLLSTIKPNPPQARKASPRKQPIQRTPQPAKRPIAPTPRPKTSTAPTSQATSAPASQPIRRAKSPAPSTQPSTRPAPASTRPAPTR